MTPRVLIIIDTAITGGPGRGLFQLVDRMHSRSIPYRLCTFQYPNPRSTEFITEAKKRNVILGALPQAHRFDIHPIRAALAVGRTESFNVVQSHGYKSHLVAAVVARRLGIPWIAWAHGTTAEDWKVKLYHRLDDYLLRLADIVVTVSPPLHRHFTTLRGEEKRTELILNAIDPDKLAGNGSAAVIRSSLLPDERGMLIGCIGRLSHEKGQDALIQAWSRVSRLFPSSRLLLLGDGPLRDGLTRLIKEVGLSGKVIICPHQTNVRDYYEALNLLVLPSRSEGLPNVLLEAMSFGVPVLATNVGAVGEVITSGNGWIIPPNDEQTLANALVRALSDPDELAAMGERGRRSLFPKFCPSSRADKVITLYFEMVRSHFAHTEERDEVTLAAYP